MRCVTFALTLVLAALATKPASAGLTPQTEAVIARYLAELNRVETTPGRTSIEPLFTLTDTLQDCLLFGEPLESRDWSRKEHPPTMEDLSESEYAALCDRLRGIGLTRNEVVIAEPDSETFAELATRKGLEADREFMGAYFTTKPHAWPSYVVRQTDFGGCDDYGTGKMVALYDQWRRYRSAHPKDYVQAATREAEEIERLFVGPGCVCGGPDSVTRELQLLLSRHPNDPISPKVRDVLEAIREGRSDIRFQGSSG